MSRFLIFIILISTLSFSLEAETSKAGVVENVEGSAYALRRFKKHYLKKGSEVREKDYVVTKKDSSLRLRLKDNSVVKLASNSTLKLKEVSKNKANKRKVYLNLLAGTVRAKVVKLMEKESFIIKTPSAVAGVRGTDFTVSYKVPERTGRSRHKRQRLVPVTRITVGEGRVEVRPVVKKRMVRPNIVKKAIFLNPLEQTTVRLYEAPEPIKKITKSDLFRINFNVKLEETVDKKSTKTNNVKKAQEKKRVKKNDRKDVKKESAEREEPKQEADEASDSKEDPQETEVAVPEEDPQETEVAVETVAVNQENEAISMLVYADEETETNTKIIEANQETIINEIEITPEIFDIESTIQENILKEIKEQIVDEFQDIKTEIVERNVELVIERVIEEVRKTRIDISPLGFPADKKN